METANLTKEVYCSLTGLEIFFISTTIASVFFNLFQAMIWWRDQKNKDLPLSNILIALFNDIKQKRVDIYSHSNILFDVNNPQKDLNSLKWEYFSFSRTVLGYLQGFQESVVGALVSLNPKDKRGEATFRASDYGLTDQEKEQRKQYLQQTQNLNAQNIISEDSKVNNEEKK